MQMEMEMQMEWTAGGWRRSVDGHPVYWLLATVLPFAACQGTGDWWDVGLSAAETNHLRPLSLSRFLERSLQRAVRPTEPHLNI